MRKRDGRLEAFSETKISNAIGKAFAALGRADQKKAGTLAAQVTRTLNEEYKGTVPSVEEIQDIVEQVLVKNDYPDVAKAYILYRKQRADIRDFKKFIGVKDDLKLDLNALSVLQRRYLLKDSSGNVKETPSQLFRRVAQAIAAVDRKYDVHVDVKKTEDTFYKMMADLEFLPNSPTLMNAGTRIGQLSACFVLPVEDNLVSIFDAVKATALIHQGGGGTGFSFSRLRPRGDYVKTSGGVASGPVSFMKIFDETTEEIKQGGRRRGANMGILSVHHPDIIEFVTSKSRSNILKNFNISVAVDDEFMRAVENKQKSDLVNPRTGKITGSVSAPDLFHLIATKAWETGDPGLIFIDEVNRRNPTPKVGMIESTNPCGEQPLLPYESCNLGSIDLSKMVEGGKIDWDRLGALVRHAVHFLDNVIDANRYAIKRVERITLANRKIGLGVMGFAEALIKLQVKYDSEEGIETAEKIMKFVQETGHEACAELGKIRGSFPNFGESTWHLKNRFRNMRNATVTTIAPTGTISIIAGCSSGIEPLFAVSFVRDVMEGTKMLEVNPLFEEVARKMGFYSRDLMMKVAESGSVQSLDEVPLTVKKLFVTALDISPEWHVRIQAAFQKYSDNAVSKTINLRSDATIEDVKKAYMTAWKLKCKGITVYRYGSKPQQVLYLGSSERQADGKHVVADSEFSGGCVGTACPY